MSPKVRPSASVGFEPGTFQFWGQRILSNQLWRYKGKLNFALCSPIRHYVTDRALFRLLMSTKVLGWKQARSFAYSLRNSAIVKAQMRTKITFLYWKLIVNQDIHKKLDLLWLWTCQYCLPAVIWCDNPVTWNGTALISMIT